MRQFVVVQFLIKRIRRPGGGKRLLLDAQHVFDVTIHHGFDRERFALLKFDARL